MKKVNENKGFTLAELLIVVAIIAVMVAIAIPTFADQIEKSREATDLANIRSAYADVVVRSLSDPDNDITVKVTAKQTVDKWQTTSHEVAGATVKDDNAKSGGEFTIEYTKSDGKIKIDGVEVKVSASEDETPKAEDVYTEVGSPTGNPSTSGYYEKSGDNYTASTDTEVDASKTYYTKATYTPVASPTGNPSTSNYFEKTGGTFAASTDTTVDSSKTYYTKS